MVAKEYGKCNQELDSVEGTGKHASTLGGATFERLLIMAQQALSFLSWLGHNPNSTPLDVPSNEDVKDTSSICTPTSPGRQTELYQFAIDDIEGVESPNLGLLSNILIVGCAFVYVCIWVYDGIWKFCAVEVQIEPRSEEHEHLTTFLESWVTGCLSRRVRSEEWSEEDAPEKTEWDWKTIGALRHYRFRPNKTCLFLFRGSIFQFQRTERSFEFHSEECYTMRVLGWSCKPIERLLAKARSLHTSKNKSHITIFSPEGERARRTKIPWQPVKSTRRRSLESISLAEGQKEEVCNDMCKFLKAQRVYAKTERPYRRGYLFSGPPGTGKTSLVQALAGKYGLDIYMLSLTGQNMTDEELQWLCSHLPRHCVLLIEDIDSAGINREKMRAIQEDGARQNNQVSLSGLLNAIDGVSSSDGRILVMTTNCRDQLDAALIRPGRVDREVKFTLAAK
ncbi:predicted protein [Histoplasma mississippiense (nom. inval.)]|uniref:predicted protein n=1 Tax=Ajellomyces capsulatus (strain NAm1 / WU24) TaxID=2059318 RepID=UPI000157CEC3|nr:predicted protein [Histoplasma mississippiense (nom. inval.)]EDN11144.1 predicted protein [Histoplasma mississippiense (nom. inval.)]